MAEKLLKSNLIPIPTQIIKHVGLKQGDRVEVTDDGYHIIITPVDEKFTEEEWAKLEVLAGAKGKSYKNAAGVRKHLQKLKK